MQSITISFLKKLHCFITKEKRSSLTDSELIQKYQIEHTILNGLSRPQIDIDAPLYCRGCHGESGIAVNIISSEYRFIFLYTSPTGEIKNGHSLTIIRHDPQVNFICKEIYHRKLRETALESGWRIDPSEVKTTINQMLACASQHAS